MINILKNFLDVMDGPIISIESRRYKLFSERFFRNQLWYSFATLHPKITRSIGNGSVLKFAGGGEDLSKELSQSKSIIEAIERWASVFYLSSNPAYSGQDIDPTSNGFSAGIRGKKEINRVCDHSFLEATERWALEKLTQGEIGGLSKIDLNRSKLLLDKSQLKIAGPQDCYVATIKNRNQKEDVAYWVISIFWVDENGLFVGSSCKRSLNSAASHATFEMFNHIRAYERISSLNIKPLDLIEKRLCNFARSSFLAKTIARSLQKAQMADRENFFPKIIFDQDITGPWSPHIVVHRTLVEDCSHILNGGEERFLI